MRTRVSIALLVLYIFLCSIFTNNVVKANPYPLIDDDINYAGNYIDDISPELTTADKRSSLIYVFRRACIPRGGNCDHRLKACCHNSACRCNLWGSNCRCQRMGLFQKWG